MSVYIDDIYAVIMLCVSGLKAASRPFPTRWDPMPRPNGIQPGGGSRSAMGFDRAAGVSQCYHIRRPVNRRGF